MIRSKYTVKAHILCLVSPNFFPEKFPATKLKQSATTGISHKDTKKYAKRNIDKTTKTGNITLPKNQSSSSGLL